MKFCNAVHITEINKAKRRLSVSFFEEAKLTVVAFDADAVIAVGGIKNYNDKTTDLKDNGIDDMN